MQMYLEKMGRSQNLLMLFSIRCRIDVDTDAPITVLNIGCLKSTTADGHLFRQKKHMLNLKRLTTMHINCYVIIVDS